MATGQNAIRTGRGLGPQVDALKDQNKLQQTINPDGIRSYYEKRPDFVQWPRENSGLHQLASALGSFVPELNKMAAHEEQKFFERNIAKGMQLQHELENNAMSWKEFVEKNPQYEGLNPHLERGFKAAQLNTKAQEFASARAAYYQETNLKSEKNPEVVKQKMGEFDAQWIEQNVTPIGVDADLYAKNFLPGAQAAEGALQEQYTKDRAADNIAESVGAWSENIDTTFSRMRSGGASLEQIAERLEQTLEAMSSPLSGTMTRSQAKEILAKTLVSMAKAGGEDGDGEEILELAGKIKTGTGTLGGTPEFKVAVKELRNSWDHERRRRRSEYQQQYIFTQRILADKARKTVGAAIYERFKAGEAIPDVDTLLSLPGVGMDHVDVVQDTINKFTAAANYRPINNLQNQIAYAEDSRAARLGELDVSDIGGLVAKYGRADAERLIQTQEKSISDDNPVTQALKSHDMTEARKLVKAQVKSQLTSFDGADTGIIKAREVEAEQILFDKAEIFVTDFIQKNKRKPSNAEFRMFIKEVAREVGKDPALRDFEQPRNIRSPQENTEWKTPEYWQSNTVKLFGDETHELEKVLSSINSSNTKEQTLAELQQRYGLTREQVLLMLSNQVALYNIVETKEDHDPDTLYDLGS